MSVPIGLRDLHIAFLNSDTASPVAVDYDEPERIVGAITANINPNPSSESLFGDDGPMETATTLGEVELELSVAHLPLDTQALLLGHGAPVNGVIFRKSEDTPPYVAVGFRSLKSNGNYRYTWLLKGKFEQPEQESETKGDSINFQPPTITGKFVMRECDDAWIKQADEDDVAFTESATWFTEANIEQIAP